MHRVKREWAPAALFTQPLDVEGDRFVNQFQDVIVGLCYCNATRQIRNVRTVACRTLFDNHQVLHHEFAFFAD